MFFLIFSFKDIFVTCKPGEIIGLLRRNGVGKSTLLKIIFGSLRSDRRFIRVNGIIVNNLFESRNLISYLSQYNFLPSCYGSDSIQFIQVSWDSYVLNAWDDKLSMKEPVKTF